MPASQRRKDRSGMRFGLKCTNQSKPERAYDDAVALEDTTQPREELLRSPLRPPGLMLHYALTFHRDRGTVPARVQDEMDLPAGCFRHRSRWDSNSRHADKSMSDESIR